MDSQGAQRGAPLPEIPGYRLEAVIGRGSTGTVYRAVQLAVQRKVALKILHPELAARGRAVRRLQREARTTARLSHPGIVSAIDMGHIGSLWWYAMELVEGPSLAAKLRRDGALSERDALRLFIPLCEALEHAFEQGVVHRDLKPGNILIDTSGRARIVDLGLAFAEDDPALTGHGGTLGTPHYISPEQARDPKSADVRSDIWSLGATLFHCVCGRPPFAGESVGEILSGVLYSPMPDPTEFAPELSRGLQLVLRKCLTRDPARRYQTPREVREDLEALRERRAVSVRRDELDPLLGERERRRRWIWGGATFAAVTCLVLAGLYLARGDVREGADESEAQLQGSFAALDEIEDRLERGPRELGACVAALDALAGSVPSRHAVRADALNLRVRKGFSAAIQSAHAAFLRDFERLRHEQRDLVGALALVESEFPARLRGELGLTERQLGQQRDALGLRALEGDLRREIELRVAELVRRVERVYAQEHGARAQELELRGQWRRARELRSASARELLERLQLSVAGLPSDALEAALARVQSDSIDRELALADSRWTAADLEREAQLAARERQLWAELELRKVADAAGRMRARWRELLERDSLSEEQLLPQVSDRARSTLERAVAELSRTEAENERADAELALRDFLPEFQRAITSRAFDAALASIEVQLARRTMAPVLARLEELRQEATILDAILRRAAAEIERLGESRASTRLWLGLEREGVVEQAHLPLERGFRFVTADNGQGLLLALRPLEGKSFELVSRLDLERLAGLNSDQRDPDLRLQAALLRERTGALDAALELWPLPPPTAPQWASVWRDLNERLETARAERSRQLQERRRSASELLFLVRRAAQNNETASSRRQLEHIDTLLREFADVEDVKGDTAWLRQRREELQRGPGAVDADTFRAAYGPNSVDLLDNRRVALRFVLDADYRGQFQRNQWQADARGWTPARIYAPDELDSAALWPTLSLRPPLDVEQALELELAFEQPTDAGPPRLLAVSLAGVHVVLVGASDDGGSARYAIVSGSSNELRNCVQGLLSRARGVGANFKGLSKGGRHQLRIELRQGRGKVELALDGERLDSRAVLRPDSSSTNVEDRVLVVRSLERLRLLEATLRASY